MTPRKPPHVRLLLVLALLLVAGVTAGATQVGHSRAKPLRHASIRLCGDANAPSAVAPRDHGVAPRSGSRDRWDILSAGAADCTQADRSIGELTAQQPAHVRSSVVAGPAGWHCYVTARSGLDGRAVAGVCRNGSSGFFAWHPHVATPAHPDDDGS